MAVLELLILSHDIHQQMSSADLLLLISVTHTHTQEFGGCDKPAMLMEVQMKR